jgi:hypothetical protein
MAKTRRSKKKQSFIGRTRQWLRDSHPVLAYAPSVAGAVSGAMLIRRGFKNLELADDVARANHRLGNLRASFGIPKDVAKDIEGPSKARAIYTGLGGSALLGSSLGSGAGAYIVRKAKKDKKFRKQIYKRDSRYKSIFK